MFSLDMFMCHVTCDKSICSSRARNGNIIDDARDGRDNSHYETA